MKILFVFAVIFIAACQGQGRGEGRGEGRGPPIEKCRRGLLIHHCHRGGYRKEAYYFDPGSSACRPYHYFCGPPDFTTIQDCIDTCNAKHKTELPLFCYRLVDYIHCPHHRRSRRHREYFSYSPLDGQCKRFTTRCRRVPSGKRANVFHTMADCQAACPQLPQDNTPPLGPHPGCLRPLEPYNCSRYTGHKKQYYTFNACEDTCTPFTSYCNFPNNPEGNIFKSKSCCEASCLPGASLQDMPQECYKTPDSNPCGATDGAYNQYWSFVSADGKCAQFASRCTLPTNAGGNVFATEDECAARCTVQDQDICSMKKDKGPCHGHHRRYYYDQNYGDCKKFRYGGCEGNRNNFRSMHECRRTCMGRITDETQPDVPAPPPQQERGDASSGETLHASPY